MLVPGIISRFFGGPTSSVFHDENKIGAEATLRGRDKSLRVCGVWVSGDDHLQIREAAKAGFLLIPTWLSCGYPTNAKKLRVPHAFVIYCGMRQTNPIAITRRGYCTVGGALIDSTLKAECLQECLDVREYTVDSRT